MALRRIAAVLSTLALAACFDPTGERTRRDLAETGHAVLGDVRANIDQGVALGVDAARPFVRFRANAPNAELSFTNAAGDAKLVTVELINAFESSAFSVPSSKIGRNAFAFEVNVPAGGEAKVTVRPESSDVPGPFRFAWVGDVQGGNDRFTHIRARINADPSIEFTVFAGDVTNQGSQEEIDAFLAVANELNRPWYSVLGNHEALMAEPTPFQRSVGRINVRFDHKGARFVLLDSASGTLDPWTYEFLDSAMAPGEPRTRIVGMHVPPLDPEGLRDGGFNDRNEGTRVLEMLARGGTDLLMAGHIHTLRFTSLAGIPTWISGNGGSSGAKFDGSDLHYLAVSVDPLADVVNVEPVLVP